MAKTTSSSSSKPKGLSLHIGLNAVSPAAYGGWSGDLAACEFDAKDMAAIAASRGMKSTVLLTKKGTRAKTLAAMRKAAKALRKGDFFFLTYSGHGGQVPDVTGEEADKQDETWCLYDGQLIDDELYFELSRFAAGKQYPRPRRFERGGRAHSGVLRQLPQRHRHPQQATPGRSCRTGQALENDADLRRPPHLSRAPAVLRQLAEERRESGRQGLCGRPG